MTRLCAPLCPPRHRPVVAFVLGGLLLAAVAAGPVSAQATTDSGASDSGAAEFSADETAATIERIRPMLYMIAVATGGLLVVYIWHTNPRRRMGVASRRREASELAALGSLEDAFVLPGELGVDDVERPTDGPVEPPD